MHGTLDESGMMYQGRACRQECESVRRHEDNELFEEPAEEICRSVNKDTWMLIYSQGHY